MTIERTQARILAAMPGTLTELAERGYTTKVTAGVHVKAMRAEKRCHIGGWNIPPKGAPAAIHHAGPGEDVPDPRQRRPETASRPMGKIPPRDPITTALFGPA